MRQKMKITALTLGSLTAAFLIALGAYLVPKYGWVGSYYAVQYQLTHANVQTIVQNVSGIAGQEAEPILQAAAMFTYHEIDPAVAGDCKMVGDIDGDGYPDLVIGGFPNEKLHWYRYPDWKKTEIATPNIEFTTDGALGDVDKDGDLDIILPDGDSGNNLLWFKNPLPSGNPLIGSQWKRQEIGSINGTGKDVKLADFDGDGRLDVATRNEQQVMIFFQTSANTWTKMVFTNVNAGMEGLAVGDIDRDGDQDLVLQGVWVRNPGGAQARSASGWIQYAIGQADYQFKALVTDLNKDGKMDVLFSSSENTADVDWWTPSESSPTGAWTKHTIYPSLEKAHTLQVADMDRDGDLDVVLAQMHTSSAREVFIMYNIGGSATQWEKELLSNTGLHNGVVADIGKDGDYDIFGANWAGNPPVKLWLNRQDSIRSWTYKQVTGSHQRTFGLAFGDLNSDGLKDIVSGNFWYRNPGKDMLGDWASSSFPAGMHATLFVNVDNDMLPDVIAQKTEGDNLNLYWLEAASPSATAWNQVLVGSVPRTEHDEGSQGYKTAQIEVGGKPEIIISSGNGIYYFRIPNNPTAGNWPRIHVNANPSEEGFGVADIDRDGDLDIAATTGSSKRVEWYRNPGTGVDNWPAYSIGDFPEADYPDRTEVADLNGDGRPDIIVTEENGKEADAQTFWWQQPTNPTSGVWTKRLIVSQGTTNSLDIGDENGDGKIDLTLAEHRGQKRLTLWLNRGGGKFESFPLASGYESHLGARLVDLDNDGDLDIISIAWDENWNVHLWQNNRVAGTERYYLPMIKKSQTLQYYAEELKNGLPDGTTGSETSLPAAGGIVEDPQSRVETAVEGETILVTGVGEQGGETTNAPGRLLRSPIALSIILAGLAALVMAARRATRQPRKG